jgi:hypothetical protein
MVIFIEKKRYNLCNLTLTIGILPAVLSYTIYPSQNEIHNLSLKQVNTCSPDLNTIQLK